MNTVRAVRAVGSAFARQLLFGFIPIVGIAAVIIIIGGILLVLQSAWWWLLVAPLWVLIVAIGVAFGLALLLLRWLSPRLNVEQRAIVTRILGHLEIVQEVTSSPKVVVFVRVMYSLLRPHPGSYLQRFFDVKSAHSDMSQLVRSFEEVTDSDKTSTM